ncbi:MAG: hypothetical protein Q4D32_12540, partial [Eubacteriales bacterium]|nr:hypothetical protein [Eubacteriales bacterium]
MQTSKHSRLAVVATLLVACICIIFNLVLCIQNITAKSDTVVLSIIQFVIVLVTCILAMIVVKSMDKKQSAQMESTNRRLNNSRAVTQQIMALSEKLANKYDTARDKTAELS